MEDIRLSRGNDPQPSSNMRQEQQSAVTTGGMGGDLHPLHTGRGGAVREHAINQLSSDLDQEKTEDGATTQTRTPWKRGPTQQVDRITCRTQQNRSGLHLHHMELINLSRLHLLSSPFIAIVF